ncbi:MAG: carbon storage regulator CsrA [Thermoleophilia bacterium]|nr:carbon storage regulator CsrA [Thermoleophilia bacterium]
MLVLTRKKEQSIIIGDEVEIMVLGVSGDKVRLGITAPREIEVFRKEVIADRSNGNGPRAAEAQPDSSPRAAETQPDSSA